MKKILIMLLAALPLAVCAQYRSQVWSPDNGDGTFTNPVINADYSDPDVIAVVDDYYLTASSFNCMPGLPVLHSKDLVNWEIIGHALTTLYPDSLMPQHGNAVWAPCIRFHKGWYYIYWGDPDTGVWMVKTQDPAGRWEEPVHVIAGKGMIDTSPLWDDDGRCYLVNGWAGSRCGFNSVLTMRELSPDGTRAVSDPVIVFDGGNDNHTAEGPKLYKRDGWYWIMCPAGGVKTGWQLAMRSRNIYGPYEWKIVLAQGKTQVNGPHQGGWIHTAQGEDWFLHFQDKYEYGRVVWLEPVEWRDNWPVMGRAAKGSYCGEPVLKFRKPKSASTRIVNPAESDEFDGGRLGLQWQWHGDYRQQWGMPTATGSYRLYTQKLGDRTLWHAPNLLLQKTPADAFVASAKIRFAAKQEHQYGGIVMMGRSYSALVVERVGEKFQLKQLTCVGADGNGRQQEAVIATLDPTERDKKDYSPAIYMDIYLQMRVADGKCRFAWSRNGKSYQQVGAEFKMQEGKWIGAKIGFVAEETNAKGNSGWIDADWFRVTRK